MNALAPLAPALTMSAGQDHLASVWPLLGLSDGALTEAAFKAARGTAWPRRRDPGMEHPWNITEKTMENHGKTM